MDAVVFNPVENASQPRSVLKFTCAADAFVPELVNDPVAAGFGEPNDSFPVPVKTVAFKLPFARDAQICNCLYFNHLTSIILHYSVE